ncbi:glutaredoxin-like protein [Exophiala viscosa]|uniref:Glutaredoxin-like protein n=1 Tax=Exophiala viscosa TaxID=2486360 RepID=A0AAN6E355_9EURO|nr:glutaredoxin-like protein [Exophiala viscosa]
MRASLTLRAASARLTLFTRPNCGLCDTAKLRLIEVQKRRTVDYSEIDIDAAGQGQWKSVYDYDVPVLHIDKSTQPQSNGSITSLDAAKKLMHRFTVEEVEAAVDEVGT